MKTLSDTIRYDKQVMNFIQKKRFKYGLNIRTNRGFTLVEALMAAAIIGFITLPLVTVLINSSRSAVFSRNVYKAALYADSLLIRFERMLSSGAELDFPEDMNSYYELDTYNYLVRVDNWRASSSIEYKTSDTLVSYNYAICTNATFPEIFKGDQVAEISLEEGNNYIELYEDVIDLNTNENHNITLVNNSGSNVLTRLWGNPGSVDIISSGGALVAGLYTIPTNQDKNVYMLFIEVWDKKGNSLVVRTRLVFV